MTTSSSPQHPTPPDSDAERKIAWPPEPFMHPNAEWCERYARWHHRYGPAWIARREAAAARRSEPDAALRQSAQALLDACISDFGDYPDEPDDEPVASGESDWRSAITFGLLNSLKAALTRRGDAEVQPPEGAPNSAPAVGGEGALSSEHGLPLDLAPRDGTIVRLLVDYRGQEAWTPLEDAEQAWTIGGNNFDHDGEDRWRFAGWSWQQDFWCEGSGKPIAWAPFENDAKAPPPRADAAAGWPLRARVWTRTSVDPPEKVLEIEGTIGGTFMTCRHTQSMAVIDEDVPGLPEHYADAAADDVAALRLPRAGFTGARRTQHGPSNPCVELVYRTREQADSAFDAAQG